MFLSKILSQISLKYRELSSDLPFKILHVRERSTERPNQSPAHFYGMRNRFVL